VLIYFMIDLNPIHALAGIVVSILGLITGAIGLIRGNHRR
jgi:hypothetical protein